MRLALRVSTSFLYLVGAECSIDGYGLEATLRVLRLNKQDIKSQIAMLLEMVLFNKLYSMVENALIWRNKLSLTLSPYINILL